jgi:hypothetical protein
MQLKAVATFDGEEVKNMTHAERNAAILRLLEDHTREHTTSRKVARDGLIAEGIYTRKGKLKVEFGGEAKRAKAPA